MHSGPRLEPSVPRGAAAATRWSRDGNVTLFMCAAPLSSASLSSRRVIQARDSLDDALSVRRRFLGRAAARAMFILARVCHGIACWSVGWLRGCCDSCTQRSGYVVPPFPSRRCRPLCTPFVAPARTYPCVFSIFVSAPTLLGNACRMSWPLESNRRSRFS